MRLGKKEGDGLKMIENTAQISRYLYAKSAVRHLPLSGTFELTPRCNMNCRMCYIRMSESEVRARGREMTAQEWIALGEECVKQGMVFLLLTGGEPFLRKDFQEIYTRLHGMGLVLTLNSNATLINRDTLNYLRQCPPSKINITLYGGSDETYGRLCRNPSGYTQVCKAIRMLKEANVCVGINASFTEGNLADMDAVYSFAEKYEIPVRSTAYMYPPVRSAKEGIADEDMNTVRFEAEKAGKVRAWCLKNEKSPKEYARMAELARKGCFGQESQDECGRNGDEKMGCSAGRASFWVTWDGRMTPCGMMNAPVTYPFAQGFEKAWTELCAETEKIYLPQACAACSMRQSCVVCGAAAMAEGGGNPSRKPEYLCRMTESF